MKNIILIILLVITQFGYAQKNITLGILTDFEKSDPNTTFVNLALVEEIQKTTGKAFNVQLAEENALSSMWDFDKAQANYLQLSSKCDLIIVVGGISAKAAARSKIHTTPTIALGVFNTDIQDIPYTSKGTSGIPNFSYVLVLDNLDKDLLAFKELVDYKHLAFLFDERTTKSVDSEIRNDKIQQLKSLINAEVSSIDIDNKNIAASLARLPESTDAVLLAISYEMSSVEIKQITDYMIEHKIPAFSMNSRAVNLGALACFSDNSGFSNLSKKIAVMADDALLGNPLSEMPVNVSYKEELYLNTTTAKKIGFSPNVQTLFTANVITETEEEPIKTYSIQELIKKALEGNLNIKSANLEIRLSENDVRYAKSQFLPTADISASGTIIDKNRPSGVSGQAQRSIVGTGSIEQLIYSESVMANIQIQKILLEAQKYSTEQEILTQVLDAYVAYFSILQAKTNFSIQAENLAASKKNLDVAKSGASIGAKTNADVYRWESEVANATQALIESKTSLETAKFQLNTLLNNTLEDDFSVMDISIDDGLYVQFSTGFLAQNIHNLQQLNELTLFLIEESQTNYPTKKQLLSNLDAIDRQIIMNKRLFYIPTILAVGQIDHNLYRGGIAAEPDPGIEYYNKTWNAGIVVSIPIYEGNRKRINLQRSVIEEENLNFEIENLDQNLALQIRTHTLNLLNSSTKIHYSGIAAENNKKNFKLVQDNYKQGTVNITQLIDAQNAALSAKLSYSIAVYNYLINYLTLENSIGYYSMLASEDEKAAIQLRYIEFINN